MKYLYFLFLVISSACYGYTKENFYSVNSDGWEIYEAPGQDLTNVFRCKECNGIVQIQISYGPKGTGELFRDTSDMITQLKSKKSLDLFVDMIIEESTPWLEKEHIKVLNINEYSELGGLPALEYSMRGESKLIKSTIEKTFVAIQKDRMLRLSVHYSQGEEKSIKKDKINAFINSFKYL